MKHRHDADGEITGDAAADLEEAERAFAVLHHFGRLRVPLRQGHHVFDSGSDGVDIFHVPFDDVPGIKVVGEAKSADETLRLVRDARPHIVLLNLRMPSISSLELIRKILRINSEMRILTLSFFDDELYITRALQTGAAGCLTKHVNLDELVRAVRTVNAGQRYISPEIAQKLALKHLTPSKQSPFEQLSDRELQIIKMVFDAQKVPIIANKLCLSAKTVNGYRYRVFKKLGISTDVELALLAIRHGMLDVQMKVAE